MNAWAQSVITMIVTILGCNAFWAWIQSRGTAKTARDRMILGLGHAEIFRQAEKYIHRDGITADELDDLVKYFYKPYAELGGNGTAAAMIEKCKKLPIITAVEAARRDEEHDKERHNPQTDQP